jgi:hypothetical protein
MDDRGPDRLSSIYRTRTGSNETTGVSTGLAANSTELAFPPVTVAEDAGFEPARGCPQHAFQACALGH